MELDEQPQTDKSNLGGKNKMRMKIILIIGGTAALLLNNEIMSLAILNVASIWAVFELLQAMAERGERF